MKFRLVKICNGLEIDTKEFIDFNVICKQGFKLDGEKDNEWFKRLDIILGTYKPVLVVCDSMIRMMSNGDGDSKDVKKIFENLSPLMEKHGCAFSLIHHSCKNGQGFRGSGDWEYMADKSFYVIRDNLDRTLFRIKQDKERDNDDREDIVFYARDSANEDKIIIGLQRDIAGYNAMAHEEMKSCVIDDLKEKLIGFMEIGKSYKKEEICKAIDRKTTDANLTKALKLLEKEDIMSNKEYGHYMRLK